MTALSHQATFNKLDRGIFLRAYGAGHAATEALALSRRLDWPVALVSMPFISPYHPSIQIGLLKSIALARGFPTVTLHLHLDLAKSLGLATYAALAEIRGRLLGDWLFSREAFGDDAPDQGHRFLDDFQDDLVGFLGRAKLTRDRITEIREKDIPAYTRIGRRDSSESISCRRLYIHIPAKCRLVRACTSHQGAAPGYHNDVRRRQLRRTDGPRARTFGRRHRLRGPRGRGRTFPELLEALADGRDPAQVRGICCRRGADVVVTPSRPPFRAMDGLPIPCYDEYFQRVERVGTTVDVRPAGSRHSF